MVYRWILLSVVGLGLLTACDPKSAVESEPVEQQDAESVEQQGAATTEAPATTSTQTAQTATEPTANPAEATAALADTTVVPGDRVGPVTNDTSRADLATMFGEAALEDTEIAVGEGFTESGTVVTPEQGKSFAVIWVDESQSEPATVKDFGPAWQTPEGIGIGTDLAELQQILGPFELYGFGWDYGGTLVLEGSSLSNYHGALVLRLQPATAALIEQQPNAFESVQGDKLLSSDDPNLADLNLVVDEMIVYLSPGQ
ncbi:MAG: hypothetical protein AAGF98_14155 [Cyanobacteria bacterium P01_H01_bin.153]